MNLELSKFKKLISEFNTLPKVKVEPTIFEICRFPKQRYEEICSRVLAFYFNPEQPHNLNDLFIKSFIEVINCKEHDSANIIEYQARDWTNFNIITEANAEGKRLDLLIHNNKIIIGIENKITASLYNPLEQYRDLIEKYIGESKIAKKIILSVYQIGINKISSNEIYFGFVNITYNEFFSRILNNIGSYITSGNNKYVQFLIDFITEIKNINNMLEKETNEFIKANYASIQELISIYESFKTEQGERVLNRLRELIEIIDNKTGIKWWIFEEWDLGVNKIMEGKPNLGIESNFESHNGNEFGVFKIFISGWEEGYHLLKKDIELRYPHFNSQITSRTQGHMLIKELNNPTNEQIIEELTTTYNIVRGLLKIFNPE